jgi:multidrug transporter EmrE-like cation transporter
MMGWLYLFAGMVLAVVGNITVKQSHGYANMKFGAVALVCFFAANIFFGIAVKTLPLGIATVVWMGIVGLLVVLASAILFHEHITPLVGALMLIIVACSAALVVVTKA